ncbi:MAG: DUF1049 domain-containing protein [Candidatus Eisenbacteria bacterium]|nr:DUF1049 domain-containing protein [Candidatus Eisenbacteria bacterium]
MRRRVQGNARTGDLAGRPCAFRSRGALQSPRLAPRIALCVAARRTADGRSAAVWYLKAFLVLIVTVLLLLFALANSGEQVRIHWWSPDSAGTEVNLAFALLAAFFLGALCFLLISAVREIRWRARCHRLQREGEQMRQELDALRTAAIEGPLAGGTDPPPEQPEGPGEETP